MKIAIKEMMTIADNLLTLVEISMLKLNEKVL
jgi:hypothetical protein